MTISPTRLDRQVMGGQCEDEFQALGPLCKNPKYSHISALKHPLADNDKVAFVRPVEMNLRRREPRSRKLVRLKILAGQYLQYITVLLKDRPSIRRDAD